MQPERRKEIEAVFDTALDQPTGLREEWLRGACGNDEELHTAVLRLLTAHQRAQGILEGPAPTLSTLRSEQGGPDASRLQRHIGPYRLVREIGRGGMSIVYLAERDDGQFRQTVAVKLIRRGLDTPDSVQRFCAERQILASLNHPHIARLLDGGTTEDGLPYLVMEHVAGEPITDHCDRGRLTIEQRLRLFVAVARTVQHAHRNLVVHRDLKPSNILVTHAAGARAEGGEVKLLDFGIAKLLDPHGEPEASPQTRPGMRLMTPEYASPEQIRGEAVTTATDVYGLGLVLYELLCGHQPFPRQHRRRPDPASGRSDVRPPSSVISRGDAGVGQARRTPPERLRRKLRGDLDRIVMTALREEPERRYPSAEQMAEDVERYLERKPIRARRDSLRYRLEKFAIRHRWGVAVAASFVLLLGGYAATVTVKERQVSAALQRASLEAQRAEQATEFLMRLFEATHPGEVRTDAITARELLERGVARAEQFAHRPDAQARMLDMIGRTYQHLGQFDRAQPLLEQALALRRTMFGETHAHVAESLYHLARLHHERGKLDSAEVLFRDVLRTQQSLPNGETTQLARTLGGLAAVLRDRGEYPRAEQLAREALDLRRRARSSESAELADGLHDLGEILRRNGKYAEAEPLYREALSLREGLLGGEHVTVAETLDNLAALLQRRGELSEVESLYRRALHINRTAFGAEHPATARTTSNLGLLMFRLGELDAADSLYREALAIRRRVLGPQHPDVALSLGLLAAVRRRKGNLGDAETLYRESLALQRRLLGDAHPDLGHGMNGLALVLRDQQRFAAADSLYEQVLAMRLRLLGPEHSSVATTLNDRGVLLRDWGRYAEAEPLLLGGLNLRRRTLDEGHLHIEQSIRHIVRLYEQWGREERAAPYRAMLGDG